MKGKLAIFGLLLAAASTAWGNDWPQWRGPGFQGVAAGENYPVKWSASENIAWKLPMPGPSASTPVVWEDRIFVTTNGDGKNLLLALDRTGKQLWQAELGEERPGKNAKGTGSNPSPATDGQHVVAYYKSGDLACVDFDGKVLWSHNLQDMYGEDTLWWDLGTSPVLTDEHVVVANIHSGPSYLAAFDKKTGDLAWKQDRNLPAPNESQQTYATPIPAEHNGQKILIALGADHVTAHDAQSGKQLWVVGGLNPNQEEFFRSIASPVVAEGLVIAPYARGKSLTAIRLGGQGDVTRSHIVWQREGIGTDVPTPAVQDGRLYVLQDDRRDQKLLCLDLATGETLWELPFGPHRTTFSSSPIIADGKLYATREDGTTFVVALGDEPKILAENKLDEFTVSSPVLVDGQILIKTFETLYCVGQSR